MKKSLEFGTYRIAPSILAGNHANLISSIREIERAGALWAHVDIMDGHFVPNLTFGPKTVEDIRGETDLFLDVHLMLDQPDRYVEPFIAAGADLVSIHVEPDYDKIETLLRIRSLGAKCGIVMNPDTQFSSVRPYLSQVDLVLQMTVFPGFGGQSFIDSTMENVSELRKYRESEKLEYRIEVDGGVDLKTIETVKKAGADTFVSGSAFFRNENKTQFVNIFEQALGL